MGKCFRKNQSKCKCIFGALYNWKQDYYLKWPHAVYNTKKGWSHYSCCWVINMSKTLMGPYNRDFAGYVRKVTLYCIHANLGRAIPPLRPFQLLVQTNKATVFWKWFALQSIEPQLLQHWPNLYAESNLTSFWWVLRSRYNLWDIRYMIIKCKWSMKHLMVVNHVK